MLCWEEWGPSAVCPEGSHLSCQHPRPTPDIHAHANTAPSFKKKKESDFHGNLATYITNVSKFTFLGV